MLLFFIGVSGLSVETSRRVAGRAAAYYVSTTLMSVTIGKTSIVWFYEEMCLFIHD